MNLILKTYSHWVFMTSNDIEMDLLPSLLKQASGDPQTGIADIKRAIGKMQKGKRTFISEVV